MPSFTTQDLVQAIPRILQVSIRVSDLDKAGAFYGGVLGLEQRSEYKPAPGVVEHFYGVGGARDETLVCLAYIEGSALADVEPGAFSRVSFNLTNLDVKAIVSRIAAEGGTIVRELVTHSLPGGISQDMAFVADPDGNVIELTRFY